MTTASTPSPNPVRLESAQARRSGALHDDCDRAGTGRVRREPRPAALERVRRTYTEVVRPTRLAYLSLIDFVPDQEPYEHLTVIDIEPAGDRSTLVMAINPLHEEAWTQDYRDHRSKGSTTSKQR